MRTRTKVAMIAASVGAVLATAVPIVAADGGSSSTRVLSATLRGANEVSTVTGKRGAGDPDGRGGATVLVTPTQLCVGLVVWAIGTPTGAHIHKADREHNGPIVVPLTPPNAGNPGSSSVCVAVTTQLSQALRDHPHDYYVNVHTSDFPNGALRGQLGGHHKGHGGGHDHDDDDD